MTTFTKHVGKTADGKKAVVVFREIPGAEDHALVVLSEYIDPNIHDELMGFVENQGQADMDLYKVLSRHSWFDNTNVLESLHTRKLLTKVPVSEITMTPTPSVTVSLTELNSQLNKMVAKTSSSDVSGEPRSAPGTLDDKTIADQMRRQAMQFEAEAKRLRSEADTLDPSRPGRPRKAAATATAEA